MKRLFSLFLCLCLLLGTFPALAAGGSVSAPRANVTDTEGPNLISVKLTEKNKTLKPGKTLHLQVKLDDRSEIAECYAYFWNEPADMTLVVELLYDAASDSFKGEYTLAKTEINGTYLLTKITAYDKYDNYLFSTSDKGYTKFKLAGANKNAPLGAAAKIKENGKTVKPGDPVHVEIKLDKKHPEADSMDFVLVHTVTGCKWYYYVDFSPSSTKFTQQFTFAKERENGKYRLDSVLLYDSLSRVIATKKVTGQTVTLKGAGKTDNKPAKISSPVLKEKGKKLTAGDTVHVSAKITDPSGIGVAYAFLVPENATDVVDEKTKENIRRGSTSRSVELVYKNSSKKWEGTCYLPETMPDGKYHLEIYAYDGQGNSVEKSYPKQYFTFSSPDIVDTGIESFISTCFEAFFGYVATDAEIQQYGKPLASGKQKAVNVIKTLLAKSGLTGEAAVIALCNVMQGAMPGSAKKDAAVEALKKGPDYAIDTLNDSVFRKLCKEWGIQPGNLGTTAANTKVNSVDVADGHYIIKGSKAIFAGVTDKNIKTLVIKDTVKANGKTYKVTAIQGAACQGLKKLEQVTIGKNVTSIGQDAFKGCKKLSVIIMNKNTKLSSVGRNAFSGIKSSAVFVCPKKQLKKYETMIRDKGKAPKKSKFEDSMRE